MLLKFDFWGIYWRISLLTFSTAPFCREQYLSAKQSAKGDDHKDTGGEKLAESEEDLLEHRTDGTDAFDTLYIGAEKFPYRESYAFPTTGIL